MCRLQIVLTKSSFCARNEHFVVSFDADLAVVTVIFAELATAAAREPMIVMSFILAVVADVAAAATTVDDTQ